MAGVSCVCFRRFQHTPVFSQYRCWMRASHFSWILRAQKFKVQLLWKIKNEKDSAKFSVSGFSWFWVGGPLVGGWVSARESTSHVVTKWIYSLSISLFVVSVSVCCLQHLGSASRFFIVEVRDGAMSVQYIGSKRQGLELVEMFEHNMCLHIAICAPPRNRLTMLNFQSQPCIYTHMYACEI